MRFCGSSRRENEPGIHPRNRGKAVEMAYKVREKGIRIEKA